MLISTAHRLIFIHVPKTGGTSVAEALAPVGTGAGFGAGAALRRALPGRLDPGTAWFQMHDPARLVRAKLGPEVWQSYRSFAFVRHPYAHARSHYAYIQTYRYRRWQQIAKALSFESFLRWRLAGPPHWAKSRTGLFARLPDQAWFLTDGEGRVIVDRVGRFERLAEDLAEICADAGLPAPALPHLRAGSGAGPEISDEAKALVQRLYARDFELFGYER
ncbi:sulfotransferase family 2 domain-containing protein [Pseudoroseicyclus sp. CXY001]|uniref:sulfotransferase family 2 domain-containing protein n=1 Tax=Pseudoroseicyclus sp. CXY001 TaxID=3242492 RepID=UPI0035713953